MLASLQYLKRCMPTDDANENIIKTLLHASTESRKLPLISFLYNFLSILWSLFLAIFRLEANKLCPIFNRFCTSVFKLLYFAEIPSAIIWCSGTIRLELLNNILKIVHQKGLLDEIKENSNFRSCLKILDK